MADHTLRGLISLITSNESAALRQAAVRVASALKPSKEPKLNQALTQVLKDPDADLRSLAVEALGETRAEEALPELVKLVESGGPEVEGAARALGHLGGKGTKALGRVMHQSGPVLRRRIAATLALAGTDSAVLATAQSLLDEDQGVVEASAKSLAAEVPLLSTGQRKVLAEHLRDLVTPPKHRGKGKDGAKKPGISGASEGGILRVLAALHAPEAEGICWARLDSNHPASVRAAALHALAAMDPASAGPKLEMLFRCAADSEFQVVAPALMLLKKTAPSRKDVKQWLGLFAAPDVAAHVLAVEKLREVDAPEVARGLLRQLDHPDKGLRDSAVSALRSLKSGRAALFAALLAAQTPEAAWRLARAQADAAKDWPAGLLAKLFAQACKAHESEDRKADAMWYLLFIADGKKVRARIEDRALALRKKKKYAASLAYWRLLTRDPAVGPALRFELAATALKQSSRDTSAGAREADPALEQFSRLLQDPAFDMIARVRAARWLEKEDLFYLGFHFAEQPRLAGQFGREVLQQVIKRWPKAPLAKNAKQKLKSEGLN